MLEPKHQVLNNRSRNTEAILGSTLLKHLTFPMLLFLIKFVTSYWESEPRNYIRDYLSNRTATLSVGDLFAGTPQGSVISPTLFNLVILGLSQQLQQGSDGQVESALQTAIDTLEAISKKPECAAHSAKPELLLYKRIQRGRPLNTNLSSDPVMSSPFTFKMPAPSLHVPSIRRHLRYAPSPPPCLRRPSLRRPFSEIGMRVNCHEDEYRASVAPVQREQRAVAGTGGMPASDIQ
ncbi:hypothetical protein HPB52_017746 [Rhipicephalus sanguineus]|uniref:Reverse transcriptase domain-containing protein n=1 Tax=Rhipicephalus sanguineus TaxID=34632 RepID=A0A9D4PHG5_RHISA|nr:hypothetical protein HPB52_017746 [Rhipicephalus sanguineus]